MNGENYLIHTTDNGLNIFFMCYADSSGGLFHIGDNKPQALADIKDLNGEYLEESLKGVIWGKMLASDTKNFNRTKCIKQIEQDIKVFNTDFNKALLDYLKGL